VVLPDGSTTYQEIDMTTRRGFALAALLALCFSAVPGTLTAQETEKSGSPFGIGFESSWPSYGLSGIYDVNDRISAQAVVGAFGTVTNFSGRGIYRFTREDNYNVFGFGTAGLWNYSGLTDESVLGLGAGAGVELDWQRILASNGTGFPPLFSSIEIGMVLAEFEYYNFSSFSVGAGFHYRF
jgi:hypothetical protein